MSLFLAILPLGLLALVSPLQTNSGFLARLLQFLFLNRKLSGLGATSILLTMISNLLFLSCTGTRGRELVHLEQGTGKVACVVGQPVHQHGEREHDAGEDVHDREAPGHGLLHLVRGSLHRSLGEVLAHVVELHVPHACAHQQDEEADDDLSGIVGRTEGIGDADTEDAGCANCSAVA